MIFKQNSPIYKIKGEIYQINQQQLKLLDYLEQNGDLFYKKKVEISHYECFVYFGLNKFKKQWNIIKRDENLVQNF